MSDWKPIKSAPFQKIVEVKNDMMERPCLATRGYTDHHGMVSPDMTFFTSVYTPDPEGFFPTPAGKLICPNVWREAGETK